MSNKLQNIKAVQQMAAGEHSFQNRKTVAFNKTSAEPSRLVGETWEETDPTTGITYKFEQRDGFIKKTKTSSTTLQSVRDKSTIFKNCQKDECTCVAPNHMDRKMKTIHDMCYDCVVEKEHELRLQGKFNEYAVNKMTTNASEWIKRAEKDILLLKEAYTKTYEVVSNADGKTETIDARMTPAEFAEKVEQEFKEYREQFMQEVAKMENHDD